MTDDVGRKVFDTTHIGDGVWELSDPDLPEPIGRFEGVYQLIRAVQAIVPDDWHLHRIGIELSEDDHAAIDPFRLGGLSEIIYDDHGRLAHCEGRVNWPNS